MSASDPFFRHLEEIDSLFREMVNQCEARDRRMASFEDVMYLRICTSARIYQSDVIMNDYKRFFRLERASVEALLPAHIQSNPERVAAFDVIECFDTYRRLNQETGESPEQARASVTRMPDMIKMQVEA